MSLHTLAAQKLAHESHDTETVAEGEALLAEAQIHATLALAEAQADTARATEQLAREQHVTAQAVYLSSILAGLRNGDTVRDADAISRLALHVFAELAPALQETD